MRCKPNTRIPAVKNDELRFEHDISENLQRVPIIGLNGPLANVIAPRRRRKVEQQTRDRTHVAVAKSDVEIRELGIAGEVVASLGLVENVAWDGGIVALDSEIVEQQESSSGVGDCRVSLGVALDLAAADREAVGGKLPEALGFIDWCELDSAGELRAIDRAKLVGAYGGVFEVGSEDWLLEGGHHVVEEGWLWLSLSIHGDGVDVGEPEAEESVGIGVLDKAIGH